MARIYVRIARGESQLLDALFSMFYPGFSAHTLGRIRDALVCLYHGADSRESHNIKIYFPKERVSTRFWRSTPSRRTVCGNENLSLASICTVFGALLTMRVGMLKSFIQRRETQRQSLLHPRGVSGTLAAETLNETHWAREGNGISLRYTGKTGCNSL